MPALEKFLISEIEALVSAHLLRSPEVTENLDGVRVIRNGRELISFCSNDYLGLSKNEMVIEEAISALWQFGAGSGASRLVTGNNPLYGKLEAAIARVKGAESACVFGSGYLANIGVIPALVGKGDLIVSDRLVHASIIDGIKLSGAEHKRYSHNSLDNLSNILENNRKLHKSCLIITETIFSMDGDKSPLPDIMEIAKKYDAWVMTDDAHGMGVIKHDINANIRVGTLSKAVGSYGGYVCGSKALVDYMKSSARSLIYSTALPPATLAASIAALEIMESDSELCKKPLENAKMFASELGMKEPESQIVPIIIGEAEKAISCSKELEEAGFLVTAIRPPTVPKGTSRLRLTFSALHEEDDILRLADFIKSKGWLEHLKVAA